MSEKITVERVKTSRLEANVRSAGAAGPRGATLVCVHGNCSDGRFFDELLAALPPGVRAVAPDLRGYGETEAKGIDATRGVRDFADDVWSVVDAMGLGRVALLGHSVGGAVVMQMAIDRPRDVTGLVLEAPASPFGFGGTKDVDGTPVAPDYAGSGGGTANADFAKRIAEGDRSESADTSPRKVLNAFYVKPPFRASWEETLLDSVLSTRVGDEFYPGDLTTSANWPGIAPGTRGMNNAISPKYLNLASFADIDPRPPVLWVRGADDAIVSDTSVFDLAFLGKLGVVPGWPGESVAPPQPMVSQTRAVLERYKARGGQYREVVMPDTGHSPHVERFADFRGLLGDFVASLAPQPA